MRRRIHRVMHYIRDHTAGERRRHRALANIARAWEYLYVQWFPASRYDPADFPAMKRFRKRPDQIGWETWDLDCSIAVDRTQS